MPQSIETTRFLKTDFAHISQSDVLAALDTPMAATFRYIVTPNADHIHQLRSDTSALKTYYSDAWLILNDSNVLRRLAKLVGKTLTLVPGSTLSQALLANVIAPDEPITIIGGDDATITGLKARYALSNVAHHNPPMGFANAPVEVERCIAFIKANRARFVFLCVGSPRQEMLAWRAFHEGGCSGTGLPVGASLMFLAGTLKRAPRWMRALSLEWLFRLVQEPGRLWRRYILQIPSLLYLLITLEVLR